VIAWRQWMRARARPACACMDVAGEERRVCVSIAGQTLRARPFAPEGDAAHWVQQLTRPRGSGPAVAVPLQDLSLRHERFQAPPAKPAWIARAVEQHFAGEPGHPVEICATPERPDQPHDLLVVTAAREAPARLARAVEARGHRVARIVTAATALSALYLRTATDERRDPIVIVHLGASLGTAAFVYGGRLVLAREFPLPGGERETGAHDAAQTAAEPSPAGAAPPESGEEFEAAVREELQRSLMLFNHRFQGAPIEAIYLSSDLHPTRPLLHAWPQRLGIPAEPLRAQLALDLSGFGAGEVAEARAERWLLAVATAALELPGAPAIDLQPEHLRLRPLRRRVITAAATLVLGAALAMTAYGGFTLSTAHRIAAMLRGYAARAAAMEAMIDELDQVRVERAEVQRQGAFLAAKQRPARAAARLLRYLSTRVPPELCLEALTLSAGQVGPRVTLTGSARGATASAAQAQFGAFYRALEQAPALAAVEMQPLELVEEGPETSALRFELQLTLADPEALAWPRGGARAAGANQRYAHASSPAGEEVR